MIRKIKSYSRSCT